MKVYIGDESYMFENEHTRIEEIYQKIEEVLGKHNSFFSHMIIDNIEVYGDFEIYIKDNIDHIKEIQVKSKTLSEFIHETLAMKKEYIYSALPEIEKLAKEFYQSPAENTWNKLGDLSEGLQWMFETFHLIDQNNKLNEILKDYSVWNDYAKEIYHLKELINELETAIETKDHILLGDILEYEVKASFKNMKEHLDKLVEPEVGDDYVN